MVSGTLGPTLYKSTKLGAHSRLTGEVDGHHCGEPCDHGEELDDLGLDGLGALPLHDLEADHVDDGPGRQS